MVEPCRLCLQSRVLSNSHIIPKFVGRWIKDTSATGYLRHAENIDYRKQDLFKAELLCSSCEALLSKWETKFAEEIFKPHHEERPPVFRYGDWLIRFLISLSWRTVVVSLEQNTSQLKPEQSRELRRAMGLWRKFLLDESTNRGSYDHHIFLLDMLSSTSEEIHENNTNRYFFRVVDSTIGFDNYGVFVYNLFPGIIMTSHVVPKNVKGWRKTRVSDRGTLKIPQKFGFPGFGGFLRSRIKLVNEQMSKMSEEQRQRILDSSSKNPERTKNSKSLEMLLADKEIDELLSGRGN